MRCKGVFDVSFSIFQGRVFGYGNLIFGKENIHEFDTQRGMMSPF